MGYTHSFGSYEYNPVPMTRAEVVAGVAAIAEVAARHPQLMEVTKLTETAITVAPIRDEPVESFRFAPTEDQGYWTLRLTFCKTNRCQPEDAVVVEMLDALQAAVGGKLVITDGDFDSDSYELMGVCQELVGVEAYRLTRLPFRPALGLAIMLLLENGVTDPEGLLQKDGVFYQSPSHWDYRKPQPKHPRRLKKALDKSLSTRTPRERRQVLAHYRRLARS